MISTALAFLMDKTHKAIMRRAEQRAWSRYQAAACAELEAARKAHKPTRHIIEAQRQRTTALLARGR